MRSYTIIMRNSYHNSINIICHQIVLINFKNHHFLQMDFF